MTRRAKGVQGRQPRGAHGREHRTEQRDEQAEDEGRQQAADRQRQADHQHRPGRRQEADHRRGQHDARHHPNGAADDAERERLAHDDAQDLARGRPRRTEEPELAGTLADGHGQGVAHEERADHEGDRAEEQRDPDEALLGRCESLRDVGRSLGNERLCQRRLDGVDLLGGRRVTEIEVDVANRRGHGQGRVKRRAGDDDDVAPLEGAKAGVVHEADDPQARDAFTPPGDEERVPDDAPIASRPRCRHERVGRRVRRERDAFGQAGSADDGVDLRVDPEHEEREDALVFAGRGRDGEAALRDGRRRNDPWLRADRLHCPWAEALVGEGAEADIGLPEEGGGRTLKGLLGGRSSNDRARHRGDAERDSGEGECGAKPARQQPAPGERPETHRSYSPRADSRRMSGVASWSPRRPRSISSRISPSRTTSTRSA